LEQQPGKTLLESFENCTNDILNESRKETGRKTQDALKDRNSIKNMVQAGSKGSFFNISQIVSCVGQQNIEGKRIRFGFNRRTLPHFGKDDYGMESKGFVENSYLRGLSPQEFYFHAMAGREGLIDTAVKTSETGYIQRRLVKAMESVMARYDGTLRTSNGNIVQFLYGEDGMDATYVESQRFDFYTYSEELFKEKFWLDVNSESFGYDHSILNRNGEPQNYISQDMIDICKKDTQLCLDLYEEYQQLEKDRRDLRMILKDRSVRGGGGEHENYVYLPVNIDRCIVSAKRQFHVNVRGITDLSPRDVLDGVKYLCQYGLIVVPGEDPLSREAQQNATLLFQIFIRSKLSCKRILKNHRINTQAFTWLIEQIQSNFKGAMVHPGEMAGVLAAQSLGEPATQMTLNTFHNTGISSKNVTLGVPRLNELLNVSKSVKTPSVTVYVNEDIQHDQDEVHDLKSRLEYCTLLDIAYKSEIIYDPNPLQTILEQDQDLVHDFFNIESDEVDINNMSRWVLRIELQRKAFHNRNLRMEEVAARITDQCEGNVHIVYTETNSDNLILRIRILSSLQERQLEDADVYSSQKDDTYLRALQRDLLKNMVLLGIPGIHKVYVSERRMPIWVSPGGFDMGNKEWILETDGTNLMSVLSVRGVDHTRTYSNDMVEVFSVLGIEGVRTATYQELYMVLSFDGSYVNYRHIAILVDVMTIHGYLMAISRHGINRGDAGPMLRASFEETVEVLMQAAMFSQKDEIIGVTENIMLGQLAQLGSGSIDLLIDDAKLVNAIGYTNHTAENVGNTSIIYNNVESPTPHISSPSYSSARLIPFSPRTPLVHATNKCIYSPGYNPTYNTNSPGGCQVSPGYQSNSWGYTSVSPAFNPMSPAFNPMSPTFNPMSPTSNTTSHAYSPMSPAFCPTSPAYSPMSPAFSPTSPAYSPMSPAFSPTSPGFSSTSPGFSPTSPAYSPMSPAYSPTSPAYSPMSPAFSPMSPAFSPMPPAYSPMSPAFNIASSVVCPRTPTYVPTSPVVGPK
jgi:DNA-directed RNA polymerase II subunit RPB1